ncbi:hypothetical protein [Paenibacillus antri]|uniref:hypothetical protein n=1 Tax=Paenibacillus antri TaxID=2582848 RepID=UPI001EE4B464|nr:hypothetical protein [Paenibacillus antri]
MIFEGGSTLPFKFSIDEYLKLAHCSLYLLEGLPDFLGCRQLISSFYNRDGKKQCSSGISNAFANVFWMYNNFPENYNMVLSKFFEIKSGQVMYMHKANYERMFENERFRPIRDTYCSFVIKKIDAGEIRRDFSIFKTSPELLEKRNFVRKEEARTITGVSNDKLLKIARSGSLKILVKEGGKGKYLINRNSLNKAITSEHALLTKREVGLLLGIHVTSVEALITSGMLTPICSNTRQYAVFDVLEVDNILKEFRGKVSNQNVVGTPFRQLIYGYNKFSLSIIKILEFTRRGLLNPFCMSGFGTLADNLYLESEVIECISLLRNDRQEKRGYYFAEVCTLLRIGEKGLHAVLKKHQINADLTIYFADGRKKRYFKCNTVDKIRYCIEKKKAN